MRSRLASTGELFVRGRCVQTWVAAKQTRTLAQITNLARSFDEAKADTITSGSPTSETASDMPGQRTGGRSDPPSRQQQLVERARSLLAALHVKQFDRQEHCLPQENGTDEQSPSNTDTVQLDQ